MVWDVVGGARCVVTVAGLSGKVDHERQLAVVEERGVYQGMHTYEGVTLAM